MIRNIKHFSRSLVSLILILFISQGIVFAQEQEESKEDKTPVESSFETTLLIDNQTNRIPAHKGFEFMIHHRMGLSKNGISDLWGIYGASNIRLGVLYGLTKNLALGFGTEKDNKMQEFQLKWKLIPQTKDGSMPVSVTFFGNTVIDGAPEEKFGSEYEFTDRLSYFGQIILGRRFNDRLSLQAAAGYAHFNFSKTSDVHDNLGLSFGGRMKVWREHSIIFEYDYPIQIEYANNYPDYTETTPNLGIGFEIASYTHTFQLFYTNRRDIIPQQNYLTSHDDFMKEGWVWGFNITIRF